MKNFFLLCCLALYSVVGYAETINVIKAKSIAEAFINSRNGTPGEAVLQKRPFRDSEPNAQIKLLQTIELEANDPALYIFNGEHSFVIVSAENEYGEVLAYSDENCFDHNGEVAPFTSEILEFYKQQIKQTRLNRKTSRTTINFGSGKLLKTAKFGQNGSFWDEECPRINGQKTYAGCGASALAIIMKYYNWPSSGTGVASVEVEGRTYTVDFSNQTYDWNAIPNESPYEVTWSDYAKKEVAKILYHVGVAAKMEYDVTGSSSYTTDLGPALVDHFKYKAQPNAFYENYGLTYYHESKADYTEEGWIEMMKQEIDQNRPFVVWAKSGTGAHIFVCDGYDKNGLFHYNLGWSGTSNGYYSMNSIDGRYDLGIAIIGLEPNGDWVPDPNTPTITPTDPPSDPPIADGEHEYVDLGLPSRTLWAKTNIGAEKAEDFGEYFAWGETKPKNYYDWSTYKYYDESSSTITKYTSLSGNLAPSDDAATANWGEDWRMPTMDEMNELRSRCSWQYTKVNGVEGYMVTGPNGNSIFLPTAGLKIFNYRSNSDQGRYWSSSCAYSNVDYASYLLFDSGRYEWYMVYRSYGHSVRPVYAKKNTPVKVTSVEVVPSYVSLTKGNTVSLTAIVSPDNAEEKRVTWTSSNERIATVSSDGVVTANAVGSCYIYASSIDGSNVYGTCQIEVAPILVESITLNHTSYELNKGESLQLEATVLPEDAENRTLVWSTSDENVVMVTYTGKVVYVDSGSATITATATDGSGVSVSCIFSAIQGIINITTDGNINVGVYSADGKKIKQIQQGLNIITDDKGNTKKIIIP